MSTKKKPEVFQDEHGPYVIETLRLDGIEATAATQVRVKLDKPTIDQYTDDVKNGAVFPELDVYREANSERTIMADGFHRQRSFVNAGIEEWGCKVREGGMLDALMHALGCNNEHGLRRTNLDKRHAVQMALKDPELSKLTNKEIADICRVTDRTVRRILNDQLSEDENDSQNRTKSAKKKKPKPPTDDDIRDNGAEPTQEDVECAEVRQACSLIKALPYGGEEALRLPLDRDDIADLEYISTWAAAAVIAYRSQGD